MTIDSGHGLAMHGVTFAPYRPLLYTLVSILQFILCVMVPQCFLFFFLLVAVFSSSISKLD